MQRTCVAVGIVDSVLLTPEHSRVSVPQREIKLDPAIGVYDDRHANDRYVGSHDTDLLAVGATIGTHAHNVRQVTLVSRDELSEIGDTMGVPGFLPASLLAANVEVSGIGSWTELLKPGTLLTFQRFSSDQQPCAILGVWEQISPCSYPHQTIVEHFADTTQFEPAAPFLQAAQNRRGVAAMVLTGGSICARDLVAVWQ